VFRNARRHLLQPGLFGHNPAEMLKPVHWTTLSSLAITLPCLWIALAYGGLPHLWSHHERKLMPGRREIVSYTAQDIPADPVNLRINGSEADIDCAFARAGWSSADKLSLLSSMKIAASVLFNRPYPQAPVSPLYVNDRAEDLAFQLDEGKSAYKRHHVRLWRVGPNDWLGAASFDRGVGLSLFTLLITHHIGPNVDREREMVGALLIASGGQAEGEMSSQITTDQWHRNGGGDKYSTDGAINIIDLGSSCQTAGRMAVSAI
jgi:hypothetical protein